MHLHESSPIPMECAKFPGSLVHLGYGTSRQCSLSPSPIMPPKRKAANSVPTRTQPSRNRGSTTDSAAQITAQPQTETAELAEVPTQNTQNSKPGNTGNVKTKNATTKVPKKPKKGAAADKELAGLGLAPPGRTVSAAVDGKMTQVRYREAIACSRLISIVISPRLRPLKERLQRPGTIHMLPRSPAAM